MILCGPLVARALGPALTVTGVPSGTLETSQTSIALRGTAPANTRLTTVRWVNQFEQRGSGTVSATPGGTTWTLPAVALRVGVNLITVTGVDASNHSASVHLAINRKPAAGTPRPQSLKVGSGFYQNRPIVYQRWHGHAVVEGDILLPSVSSTAIGPKPSAGRNTVKAGTVTPDGIGISYSSLLWPTVGGVHQIPYVVTNYDTDTGVCSGTSSAANLTAALSSFNSTNSGLIQFVPQSTETNYVNICVDGSGSSEGYAYVGMVNPPISGGQLLYCGTGCTEATWLHEMGHALGLLHEHQRPDRANYITLNLANADLPNVPGNFTLFSFDYQTLGLYDYASVMHYGAFDFSKVGLPVLESIPAGIPMSNDVGYSVGDVDQIKRLYGATPAAVTVTTNPAGLQIVVDGTTYTAPQTFSFALNSSHTLNLPADPQNTNPADGSTYAFGNWNDQGARSHTIVVQPGSGALTAPSTAPAVTVYEANFVRLQPFVFMTPAVYPDGSGSLVVSPTPISEYGGTYLTDRTLVTLTLTENSGFNFWGWYNLPYPPSSNPYSFYLQSPITAGQAVLEPTSTPVTIIGESITGPNTWNPYLAASVDGTFTLLPSGFTPPYNGTGWNGGMTHTVDVDQTQSPYTTNVYYNWNSWSDGGAISHTITQPSSGSQTISASFTPFYATYTVPGALGGANGICAGGVTTFPSGTSYPLNTAFDFYVDGTSVMSTATPNPDYPAMVFAGWTGSLSGSTNPSTTTIHDQFVPTANFNLIAAPLAITSLAPASAAASASNPLDVTINGTGFTSASTNTYWNDNYRANTFVSSTQLIMHLTAGDLVTPGGQDVFIGNYTTDASNNTCGVYAESSFLVLSAPVNNGPGITYSPSSLTFAATAVGTTSATQPITLTNSSTSTISIAAISPGGTNYTSFSIPSKTCTSTLAAGATCVVNVAFKPTTTGALSGTIGVTYTGATGSPQRIPVSGTGTSPPLGLTYSPSSLTFASTAVGTTSATQPITLTNSGTTTISIAAISPGGTNYTSFSIPSKTCTSTLAAGATCVVNVAFKPTTTGALSGTIGVTYTGATGSPQRIPVSGTGTPPPLGLTYSPSSLTFASTPVGTTSATQPITLTNSGSTTISIAAISPGGTNYTSFSIPSKTCTSTLAAGATCVLNVAFKPTTTGALSGTIGVTYTGATGSPQRIPVSGTGTSPPLGLTYSPSSLTFASTAVGTTSATQPITLTNSSSTTISIAAISPGGTNYTSFSIPSKTCTSTLAAGATCVVNVAFKPTTTGALSGTIGVTYTGATGSPQRIPVSGTGM